MKMKTELLTSSKTDLEKAVQLLKKGEIVAFPTETVYGLGANALDKKAIRKVFSAKGRPVDNPLIVHISKKSQLNDLVENISEEAKILIKHFWPGPLTLIFFKSDLIPNEVSRGLDTVGIRLPKHKVAKKLISLANIPLAAPSANTSGKPSPTSADHVISDLKNKVSAIIDGGKCDYGLESTVVDTTCNPLLVLRPGGVTLEDLRKVLGRNKIKNYNFDKIKNVKIKSPGVKYSHYSPKAEVILIEGNIAFKKNKLCSEVNKCISKKESFAVISKVNHMGIKKDFYYKYKSKIDLGKNMFYCFRKFDDLNVDKIFVEGVCEKDLGLAVMNRLRKASKKIINPTLTVNRFVAPVGRKKDKN